MRDRNYLLWVAMATFFLVLLNLPSTVSSSLRGFFRDSLATYQGAVTRAISGLYRTSSVVGNMTDVVRERDELRREAAGLHAQVRSLDRMVRENSELRDLLNFKQRLSLKTVPCEVIARDDGGLVADHPVGQGARGGNLGEYAGDNP